MVSKKLFVDCKQGHVTRLFLFTVTATPTTSISARNNMSSQMRRIVSDQKNNKEKSLSVSRNLSLKVDS